MAEENINYEFISNGGCTRCDAMDGRLSADNPQPRPHPNCNCQIVKRDFGAGSDQQGCDENRMRYDYQGAQSVHHDGPYTPDAEFDVVHTFIIRCPDGESIEADVLTTITYGELAADFDGAMDQAFAEALELIEDIAATECQHCPEPPLLV